MAPKECLECPEGINCFNGRYCKQMRRSVEYARSRPAKIRNNKD